MSLVEAQFPLKWAYWVFFFSLMLIAGDPVLSAALSYEHGEVALASTEQAREFSARLTWRKDGKIFKAQLFVKGDRYRIEYLGGMKTDLGFASVTIVRLDRQRVWYIYSQRRLVLSVPSTDNDVLPFSVKLKGEVSRTLIGDAMAAKRPAMLYEVTALTNFGTYEKYYEWVDVEQRDVLLKLLSQERDWWVEYEHVVISQQPDFFFEAPLGYRKVEAQEIHPEKW